MNAHEIRELKLLTEISSGGVPLTQRVLARRQGVALGLANLLLRRLATKGYIKIRNVKGRRLRYLITPQGIAEKTRLAYEYLHYSLYSYRQIRRFLAERLMTWLQGARQQVVIVGTGEVAEIAYLTIWELGLHLAGVVDEGADKRTFMTHPVRPLTDLTQLSFDGVIVASMRDRDQIHQQLIVAGIPEEAIVAVPNSI